MADPLSRRYMLLFSLSSKLLGFEHIKDMYVSDLIFFEIYASCNKWAVD